MKILSVKQVQLTDAYTISNEPIPSIELMERAAEKFSEACLPLITKESKIAVVCGTGNNGGDGLAVSRILQAEGYLIDVFIIQQTEGGSKDFQINLDRIKSLKATFISAIGQVPAFLGHDVIIDAIFGSGLTRPVTGLYGEVIEAINTHSANVIAIDIPSGLYMDAPAADGAIIKASTTISFQLPKLAFFLPENYIYVGQWQVVDIGLNNKFIAEQESKYFSIDQVTAKKRLPKRSKFDHKGSYGHAQLIGGSYGKIGAMVLAAEAALRTGAGLVSANVPRCGHQIMQTAIPEAMLISQKGEDFIAEFNADKRANVIGLGPGLGVEAKTIEAFGDFLRTNTKPIIIDADGINILAKRADYLELLPDGTILTPHIKEFDRLAGESDNNWQRLEKARHLCSEHNIIVILKGAHTAVIEPGGNILFNTTGNPGMATAGSGDVLLGILVGLVAQGLGSADAAKLGVYLHGLAGDLAVTNLGPRSLIAGDIISYLGKAFLYFEE